MRMMIRFTLVAALLLQTACVTMVAPKYQSGMANSQVLGRQSNGAPLKVGAFTADAKLDKKALSVRGSTLKGGDDGKYSTYLRDALMAELKAAGRLDDKTNSEITGELLENKLNGSGMSTGNASVKARFVIKRDGAQVYDRTLSAQHEWDSSFIGAIAIPAAFDNYPVTIQKLFQQLFSDPEFERATSR